jgi:hypothetical protein
MVVKIHPKSKGEQLFKLIYEKRVHQFTLTDQLSEQCHQDNRLCHQLLLFGNV